MLNIDIPGFKNLSLEHLVLDFNGTLAVDGKLMLGVFERLRALTAQVEIHVVTADTFGHAKEALEGLKVVLTVLAPAHQAEAKRTFVEELGPDRVVAIGNGRNDRLMLQVAALSMAVSSLEGTAMESLMAADLYVPSVQDALDLLISPLRLIATLRA
jgi:soluble P-type ATPase